MSQRSCGTATRPPAVSSPTRKRAALAAARRVRRLTARAHDRAVGELNALNAELVIVGVDEALAQRAGELADERALRGYDAVHLASALALGPGDTIRHLGSRPQQRRGGHRACGRARALITDRRHSDRRTTSKEVERPERPRSRRALASLDQHATVRLRTEALMVGGAGLNMAPWHGRTRPRG